MSEPAKKLALKKIESVDLRDTKELADLLKQPATTIAAFLTGALSAGRQDAILIGGRMVQAAIAGNLMKQFGREVDDMIKKGKIKEDYAETKYGFKSLSDMLKFIDSEAPDEDRFEAVKNLFFALNSTDTKESDEVLMYKLFKISMELSATEIMMLKTT